MQEFLESRAIIQSQRRHEKLKIVHQHQEMQMESIIRDAAYRAEDIVDSKVREFHQATTGEEQNKACEDLCRMLELVIKEMESTQFQDDDVLNLKKKISNDGINNHNSSVPISNGLSIPDLDATNIVGFNQEWERIMDRLTGRKSNLDVVAIVGMGGVGKTTLARRAYNEPLLKDRFDCRAWTTASQQHNVRGMLLHLYLPSSLHPCRLTEKAMET